MGLSDVMQSKGRDELELRFRELQGFQQFFLSKKIFKNLLKADRAWTLEVPKKRTYTFILLVFKNTTLCILKFVWVSTRQQNAHVHIADWERIMGHPIRDFYLPCWATFVLLSMKCWYEKVKLLYFPCIKMYEVRHLYECLLQKVKCTYFLFLCMFDMSDRGTSHSRG